MLLGVNSDASRAVAQKAIATNKLNWRSWWDGPPGGPIASQFGIEGWPTMYLIDAKGVVRQEWRKVKVPGHAQDVLDAAKESISA